MDKKNRISIKLASTWEKPPEPIKLAQSSEPEQSSELEQTWYYPPEEETYKSPTLPFSHYQKRQRKSQWSGPSRRLRANSSTGRRRSMSAGLKSSSKLVLTIGAAVGLGLVMGMMVLNMFSNLNEDPISPSSSGAKQQEMEQTIDQAAGEPQLNQGDVLTLIPSGSTDGNSVHLPARSYYVVQAGAFTEKAMADEGLQLQQQQGWAGLLLGDEAPYRLYAGLTTSKDEAMLLGQFYREKNMDIYVKEHQTVAVANAAVSLNAEILATLPAFITKGDLLLTKMGSISAKGIMNPSETLEATEWQQLQELHRSFLQEGQVLFSSWSEKGKAEGESLLRQVTEGMNALDAYHKQKHPTYLWKVQQALLQYVEAYEQFTAILASAE